MFLGIRKLSSKAGFVRDRAAAHSADRDQLSLAPIVFKKTIGALAE
jgi:hypothetical protein